jgi:hypothetical protein
MKYFVFWQVSTHHFQIIRITYSRSNYKTAIRLLFTIKQYYDGSLKKVMGRLCLNKWLLDAANYNKCCGTLHTRREYDGTTNHG